MKSTPWRGALGRLIRAFTLIEMLTVIAIIVVLAGILLPALKSAMERARFTEAKSDIANLQAALASYALDFGMYPPDRGTWQDGGNYNGYFLSSESIASAGTLDVPAEALVFFLGTQFAKQSGRNGDMDVNTPGSPSANALSWTGADKGEVFASITPDAYMEFKRDKLKDYDGDGFDAFVDPWGYPYIYNGPGNYGGGTNGNPVHNRSSFDLFSVGPNGRTNQAADTYNRTADFDGAGVDGVVMDDSGDGDDVTNGNVFTSAYTEEMADDVNNW